MKIFLLGYMGSGKTTYGKRIARSIGYDFIDIDHLIEKKYKLSINAIFQKYDENAFRTIESKALESTMDMDNIFISCGGGTPCFNNNMDYILKNGLSIYLQLSPKSLFVRLKNAKKKRPLVSDVNDEELQIFIENQLKEREKFYLQSNWTVKGEDLNVQLLVENILNHLKENK